MTAIVTGTSPKFRAKFIDRSNNPVDLDGAVVTMRYTLGGGSVEEIEATITDESGGVAELSWDDDDKIETVGPMQREWQIAFGSTVHRSAEVFLSTVRASL